MICHNCHHKRIKVTKSPGNFTVIACDKLDLMFWPEGFKPTGKDISVGKFDVMPESCKHKQGD